MVPTVLLREGKTVARATGKGTGIQAWTSGAFEAFEHAAAGYQLPEQTIERRSSVLTDDHLAATDLRYRYARKVRGIAPQHTVAFEELGGRGTVDYPRLACDFGYQMVESENDLLYLDRTCTTKGYASGVSRADAELHAINELVEYDAFSHYLLSPLDDRYGVEEVVMDTDDTAALIEQLWAEGARRVAVYKLPSETATVILCWAESIGGVPVPGIGCSEHPRVAALRAITEAHQELAAEARGITFENEGGMPLSNLDRFPQMAALAVPSRVEASSGVRLTELEGLAAQQPAGLIVTLRQRGYRVFSRVVWQIDADTGLGVSVVQVLIPGLERFADLVFGRPVVPTGRLHTPDLVRRLTRRDIRD